VTRRDLTKVNVLDVVPVRLADWENHADHVVVIRPHPRVPWHLLLLEWVRYGLAVRRIRLDPIGSMAWRNCDGALTVAEIAEIVREVVGTVAEPVEQRLGQLIRRLRNEGLLAYRDLEIVPSRTGRAVELPLT